MSTKDNVESIARNTWLAGLGAIESSVEALAKSFDKAQKQTDNLYHELLKRGEELQSKINETTDDMEARGKKLFGIRATEHQEEKLAKLNAKVDDLTTIVVKLIEKRNAETPSAKSSQEKTGQTVKAKPKAAAKSKRAATPRKSATKATSKASTTTKSTTKKAP